MRKIVLMYHCIINENGNESGFQNESAFIYKVSNALFEQEVKLVSDFIKEKKIPNYSIEFTFDDGGVSFFTIAAPILEKYGFRGVFFIASRFIDTPFFLTTAQIKILSDNGHKIASHSLSHPEDMTTLSYKEMVSEWRESTRKLEEIIGKPIEIASIPNGYGSNEVYKSAYESGIKTLYTSIPTTKTKVKENARLVGRYVILGSTSIYEFSKILTSKFYRGKKKRQYDILRIVHLVLGKKYNKVKKTLMRKKNKLD